MTGDAAALSFEKDVRPLFRDKDRESMVKAFDLWSYADVSAHADAILRQVAAGSMPCDGAWPSDRVDIFRQWTESGKLP